MSVFKVVSLPFLFLGLFLVYPLFHLILTASSPPAEAIDWELIRILGWQTLLQAFLSALGSLLIGTCLAILYSEGGVFISKLIWRVSLLCFSLPTLLVSLVFLGFWGRSGFLGKVLFDQYGFDFYGWKGIILAHVFLNFPVFVRLVGFAMQNLDRTEEMAALSFGSTRPRIVWTILLPKLLPALKEAFLLTFLYSLTSFLIVLLLGGGIRFSTLEVAIYEAVKLNFNPSLAIRLSVIQFLVGMGVLLLLSTQSKFESRAKAYWFPLFLYKKSLLQFPIYAISVLFLLGIVFGPLGVFALQGLRSFFQLSLGEIYPSIVRSFTLGLSVAALTLVLAFFVSYSGRIFPNSKSARFLSLMSSLPICISTVVIALSLLWSYQIYLPSLRSTLVAPVIAQTLLFLPISIRLLAEGLRQIPDELFRVSRSFGAGGWKLIFLTVIPTIRKGALATFCTGLALSLGEVGSLLVFGVEGEPTLSMLIFQWMGRYRFAEASGLALVLFILFIGVSSYDSKS